MQKMLPKKTFSKYREPWVEIPDLVQVQVDSYQKFLHEEMKQVIQEFTPITDYSNKKFKLDFLDFTIMKPEYDEYYAKTNKKTYKVAMKAKVKLLNRVIGSETEQEIFLTDIPMMTEHGTFILNGTERVIVPQLARSYGIFFTENSARKGIFFGAKIIPARGAWIEMEAEKDDVIQMRIDRKRKFPVTSLLRFFGLETNEQILEAFPDEDVQRFLKASLEKDPAETAGEAVVEMYRKIRDGEHATVDNARSFFEAMFSEDRYDLSKVGRYQFHKRFGLDYSDEAIEQPVLTLEDLKLVVNHVVKLNVTPGSKADDIDHLGSRRVRFAGELLSQKVRKGMTQMKRNIQDRMSTIDNDTKLPIQIVNQRPLQARIKEFFATNQLSQFMNEENVLSKIEHIRILSALGQGGLTRERAGFEVRDIHPSHYGRVCPIHTPEGPNIGLILHMSLYARVNEFGMIETPYVKVKNGTITGEIDYLNAYEEEQYKISPLGIKYDDKGKITQEHIPVRFNGDPVVVSPKEVDYVDVATNQTFSVSTSLIPFIQHDAANRALMGSNMQKQATPCIIPEAPLVGTGIEEEAARDSGRMVLAKDAGFVTYVDSKKVQVETKTGETRTYNLVKYDRSNNYAVISQRPIVSVGQKVKVGDVLADASTTVGGQVAVGQNVLMAFMCWKGHNFEDAIVISERLVKANKFSSIRIHQYECIVRDTKLGEEQTTPDIPNVGEARLRNLDEDGIVRVGAEVREGDILVGKITPKGETELTPEERLLRSIFGEKARDVKDTSMRIGHGKKGRVIGIKIFSRDKGDDLESGVLKKIYVEVAEMRHIKMGDKLAGRHGNKGVISVVLPEEDMPYMPDGTPIDIVLTPLGVPSRMNLGQVLEMHLGLAAHTLNYQAIVPPFAGATEEEVKDELEKAGFDRSGKVTLYDGQTGEAFHQPVAVGYMYILKLHHMVDDKMHARAIGPYSLITQQPLGGKSQSGGQRFGEMEVWALEGYGAAHTLREMLTVKSDDIEGRTQAFDAIIRGDNVGEPNIPASFNVLLKYLRGLALDVRLLSDGEHIVPEGPKVPKVDLNPGSILAEDTEEGPSDAEMEVVEAIEALSEDLKAKEEGEENEEESKDEAAEVDAAESKEEVEA